MTKNKKETTHFHKWADDDLNLFPTQYGETLVEDAGCDNLVYSSGISNEENKICLTDFVSSKSSTEVEDFINYHQEDLKEIRVYSWIKRLLQDKVKDEEAAAAAAEKFKAEARASVCNLCPGEGYNSCFCQKLAEKYPEDSYLRYGHATREGTLTSLKRRGVI